MCAMFYNLIKSLYGNAIILHRSVGYCAIIFASNYWKCKTNAIIFSIIIGIITVSLSRRGHDKFIGGRYN